MNELIHTEITPHAAKCVTNARPPLVVRMR